MKKNKKKWSLLLVFVLVMTQVLGLTGKVAAQKYADKAYYLVDSLNLENLTRSERQLVDSCLKVYHSSKDDTSKVNAINGIVEESEDENVWPKYNQWVFSFVQEKLATHPSSLITKSLKISMAGALNNIGFLHDNQGDIPLALDYYYKSLKIQEEIGDKSGMANSYNNIGAIYKEQGDIRLALDYYHKSLKIQEEIGDKKGMAYSYNNIGLVHYNQGDITLALDYFHKSLKIREVIGDKSGMANSYNNIGGIHKDQGSLSRQQCNCEDDGGNIPLALDYFHKSLKIREEISDKKGMAGSLANIGSLVLLEGTALGMSEVLVLSAARKNGERGLTIAQEIGFPAVIKLNAALLSKVAIKEGNYKEAFEMRNLEIQMLDSITGKEAIEATVKQQARYEYEKAQAIKDIEHEKQMALSAEREEKQKILSYSAAGASVLLIAFLLFVFNRLKVTRRQKDKIDTQKQEIEKTHEQLSLHHKEIQDSIKYAKRIQEAILPSMSAMHGALKNGFVLYKPKDVVAGDFYWLENVGGQTFFAAADCTGHGVPGAMVSVVCSNALSKALLEEGITNTGKLLDRTREIVIDRLAKSGEEVKDGMDISLCALDFTKNTLQWSGANNPLWILRSGDIIEYKHDKQPIGIHDNATAFTSHDIELQKNDTLYIFTDGYHDQFGGENGKKFRTKQLREKLLAMQGINMEEQKTILNREFDTWKGDLEQVDDVCVIGVHVC
ncbi:MAG: tetratricopeptide repeat protein [Bacteroidetes bacterium]|nr:tetratricopeptide repeat protein [Bacteroidota bacterium]HET6246040.1 tetratricopeptide repeat protein [Bacteroidia bacterium]